MSTNADKYSKNLPLLLHAINEHLILTGTPPTIHWLAARVGISKKTVIRYLRLASEEGLVTYDPSRKRTVKTTTYTPPTPTKSPLKKATSPVSVKSPLKPLQGPK